MKVGGVSLWGFEITEEWSGAEMAKARERNIEVKYFLGGQFWGMVRPHRMWLL